MKASIFRWAAIVMAIISFGIAAYFVGKIYYTEKEYAEGDAVYEEILEQWRILTKEKRVHIVVLDMPLLDTRQGRDLTGTLIADIVLQLLSYVAQTEREFIRQRQREGIEIAKLNGVHFGRKPMERPENYEEVKSAWLNGNLSARGAAKLLGVSHTAFNNWVRMEQTYMTMR